MRYRLGLMLVIVVLGLVGLSESEAACRATGDYRVTGPNSGGFLTLKEAGIDGSTSSGTFELAVAPKGGCGLCDFAGSTFTGTYFAAPNWDGSCFLDPKASVPIRLEPPGVGGTLAFGSAVIFFEGYSIATPVLNLTLGIRTDSLLRP